MIALLDQAYEDCERVVAASGSSFRAGMRLLPTDRRRAIFAVYALARRIDDIADGNLPPQEKLARLERVRSALASRRTPEDRLMLAVRDAAGHYPIPLAAFDDLLDGVESDVRGRRYATFSELESYCRCVAGSIGRLCVGVFETPDRERAERLADDLGVALQLGNILRDLDDDLRRGRVYLPSADLERFGCSASPTGIAGDATLVVAFEAQRALEWLGRGLALVPLLDRASARSVLAMAAVYRALIERIADEPRLPLQGRVSLSPWRKRAVFARSVVGLS
ncbi:MAG TPA: squalene/phytoene synthase family protein [Gaiellaceae bacterium]|nr:squalene/phytoene synthase family protein [Gaiellaceae bacterium]